ncbi:MAG: carbonate dehydratase [Giesbergeria sp.]|nr:carbonate dehydratase [Giesbergeria sp.]MBP6320706.1 carbonate dehydratase [Giesbergeria sp.]MBP7916500.1 carbonate dehydratase [Giesbergeria sp.]MBP8029479.1 carbonate dehydratase [Giesbergeria sp.]
MGATSIEELFDHNRKWAAQVERERPGFFTSLMEQQNPRYMWIGCSDSRVPANQITGLEPGEVFVHRNVANVVIPTDLNCLSTIQYAVDQLHIQHLMVVGHYGCGGVLAALNDIRVGLSDNWIQHVKDVRDKHRKVIAATAPEWRHDVLCELNAIEQVLNIAHTTVMQDAWTRGEKVTVHGWCYGLKDGLIKNLNMSVSSKTGLYDIYDAAVLGVAAAQR